MSDGGNPNEVGSFDDEAVRVRFRGLLYACARSRDTTLSFLAAKFVRPVSRKQGGLGPMWVGLLIKRCWASPTTSWRFDVLDGAGVAAVTGSGNRTYLPVAGACKQ